MRSALNRIRQAISAQTRLLLIWALVSALLVGPIINVNLGKPIDDLLLAARNKVRQTEASGKVIMVGIDPLALQEVGSWPWPSDNYAKLVDNLNQAGAKRIFFDFNIGSSRSDNENTKLAESFARSKAQILLAANFAVDGATDRKTNIIPSAELRKHSRLFNSNVEVNGFNAVMRLPYAMRIGSQTVPNVAASIAGIKGRVNDQFQIDYAIDVNTIPYLSAADALQGNSELQRVKGRDVIIGPNAPRLGEVYTIWGSGPAASTYISVLGAETLIRGKQMAIGWLPLWLIALILCVAVSRIANNRLRFAAAVGGAALLLLGPIVLDAYGIFTTSVSALALFIGFTTQNAWRRRRKSYEERGLINEISGLPNLNALRQDGNDTRDGLVAARIANYAEVATALPAALEKDLVNQIAMRIALGNGGRKVYQGDEGIFLWLVPEDTIGTVGDQLAALHAIFRSPANVAGRPIDLAINFGVDADPGRSMQSRVSSALLAGQEAANNGDKWRVYDPSRLEATEWKVSLLGELDAAIDNGQVWVAFQPKLTLSNHHISGAEALVRWSHPEKGPINPEEFVTAAERHDRIEKLTEHVLDRAVEAAAKINRSGETFDIAVNLSPRLIGHSNLRPMVAETLKRHNLAPERLILEITETAAMSSASQAIEELNALRAMGLQLSIDDYGTGFSTLDYLKRCPATELKIDRSFVRMLGTSRSDRIMVNSTIELAHSLGEQVVAEGVEDSETLQMLIDMGCDKAQGFLIGRPMDYEALLRFLSEHRAQEAA